MIPSNGWVPIDWAGIMRGDVKGGLNYYYVYYEVQQAPSSFRRYLDYRNCGIFCEGPAYAFMLSLAILIETYFRKSPNRKRLIILWITMLSTLTSSTILFISLFVALRWYLSDKKGRKIRTLLIPIMLLLFIYLIIVILETKTNRNSVMIRIGGYKGAFDALLSRPIFGYGYDYDTTLFGAGITDSLSDVIVRGGFIFTLYYLFPFIMYLVKTFKRMTVNNKTYDVSEDKNFALFLWATYVFITTVLTYTFVMLSFVAYGYLLLGEKNGNKKNGDTISDSR